jgi:glycylpeptide N-tetradecanoyltransferase
MGIEVGSFTTSRCIPSPITTLRYYHRPLNYKKLYTHKFVYLEGDAKMRHKKFQIKDTLKDCIKLDETSNTITIAEAYSLYTQYMDKYNIYMKYDIDEFKRIFIENPNIVDSYIVYKNGKVEDFFSYYKLPYSISGSNETINAGYLLTYTAVNNSEYDMLYNLVISSSQNKLDVFNTLDNMGVASSIMAKDFSYGEDSDGDDYDKMYDNRFLKGSVKLHFYLFNWKCPRIMPSQIGYQVF